MKIDHEEIKKVIQCSVLKPTSLGNAKGATVIVYKRKALFVWKDNDTLFLQGKWVWSKKHALSISDIFAADNR